jgi:hypothetical protein
LEKTHVSFNILQNRPVANHWQTLIKVENKDLSQKSELESCLSLTYTCGSGITYPVYNYAMWNLFFNWKYTIVGFTTTYAIAVYHHLSCEFKSWWGVLDTTLCDKVCQWLTNRYYLRPHLNKHRGAFTFHHITSRLSWCYRDSTRLSRSFRLKYENFIILYVIQLPDLFCSYSSLEYKNSI